MKAKETDLEATPNFGGCKVHFSQNLSIASELMKPTRHSLKTLNQDTKSKTFQGKKINKVATNYKYEHNQACAKFSYVIV